MLPWYVRFFLIKIVIIYDVAYRMFQIRLMHMPMPIISHFTKYVITYPCWDQIQYVRVKGVPGCFAVNVAIVFLLSSPSNHQDIILTNGDFFIRFLFNN